MPANPVPGEPPEVGTLRTMLRAAEQNVEVTPFGSVEREEWRRYCAALRYALRVIEGGDFLVEVCAETPPRAPDKWAIRINRRWIADYEYEFDAQEIAERLRAALLRPAATEGGETDG
jgi:hypothetical protein